MTLVSIVVPCRNERAYIVPCVQSLLAQGAPDVPIEVIIADGMSSDGTRELLAQLAADDCRVRMVDNPGFIVSTGLNRAIAMSQGDIVVRADSHTVYAPDYVRRCVEVLQSSGADCVGGPWVPRGIGYLSRAIAAAFQSPYAAGAARSHDAGYRGPVDTVYLGCWARGTLDRFGPFDESLVRNQDDEYCLRITRAGGTVWQSPDIHSWYTPRASLRAVFRQYAQYGYWKVFVIRKHRIPASIRHVVPAVVVLAFVALAIAAPFSRAALVFLSAAVGAYVCLSLLFALRATRHEMRLLLAVPPAFWAFHFGYGLGFWGGLYDAVRPSGGRRLGQLMSRSTRK